MVASRLDLARSQFDLAWALLDYHLERLVPDDLLWEPAATCWTVRQDADERWVPDWADTEPAPIPVPTIAWVTWHIGWWWTVTLDHLQRRPPTERAEIGWPGDCPRTVGWLRDLRTRWHEVLDDLCDADLDQVAPFPWQDDPDRTVAHTLDWVNVELTKNAAEIGLLRLLRAAG